MEKLRLDFGKETAGFIKRVRTFEEDLSVLLCRVETAEKKLAGAA